MRKDIIPSAVEQGTIEIIKNIVPGQAIDIMAISLEPQADRRGNGEEGKILEDDGL